MPKPSRCYYFRGATTVGEVALESEAAARDIFDRVLQKLDGYNISDEVIDEECGLAWIRRPNEPKRLCIPILSEEDAPAVRRKATTASGKDYKGLELIVDADDSTYGRVCVRDKDDAQQIISFIPDDPADGTSGGAIDFPAGIGRLRTSGAFNVQISRNSVLKMEFLANYIEAQDDFQPNADGTVDLGATGIAWREIYGRTIDSGSAVDLVLQRNNVEVGRFTSTLFTLGGAAATDVGLKEVSGPEMEVRTGSDSAYANLRAAVLRTGDGAAGAKSMEFINSAGRLILQTTPTTDRTVTIQNATHTIENTVHAAKHQNGGADEVATTTAAANAIPKADADTFLNQAWLGSGTASASNFLRGDQAWTALSAAGGLVLVERKAISANSQTQTFSSLNGETDGIYVIVGKIVNNSAAGLRLYEIRPNGLTTNQGTTRFAWDGATTSQAGVTTMEVATASDAIFLFTCVFYPKRTIGAVNTRRLFWSIKAARQGAGADVDGSLHVGQWDETATDLTSFDLRADAADGIGAGSELCLYRLVP